MTKNTDDEFLKYCNCLDEVKWRVAAIESILNGQTLGREDFDIEFSSIQLRKCLELIAFSSLIAHKKIYSKVHKNFQKHWNAKYLINDLEKLNPDFYPQPVAFANEDPVTKIKHMENVQNGYLTKDDLIFLYDKCGAALHARNPYKQGKNVIQIERPFREWIERLKALLSLHIVKLYGSRDLWVVYMEHPETGKVTGYVTVPADKKI